MTRAQRGNLMRPLQTVFHCALVSVAANMWPLPLSLALPAEEVVPEIAADEEVIFYRTYAHRTTDEKNWNVEWLKSKHVPLNKEFIEGKWAQWKLDELKGDTVHFLRIEAPDQRVYFATALQIR